MSARASRGVYRGGIIQSSCVCVVSDYMEYKSQQSPGQGWVYRPNGSISNSAISKSPHMTPLILHVTESSYSICTHTDAEKDSERDRDMKVLLELGWPHWIITEVDEFRAC